VFKWGNLVSVDETFLLAQVMRLLNTRPDTPYKEKTDTESYCTHNSPKKSF
jgi:hypothetical protein